MTTIGKPPSIVFIYRSISPFIRNDIEILQKHFNVHVLEYKGVGDVFKILFCVADLDICFSWFAGRYALLAVIFSRIFNKKSIVVAGGYDAAYAPEIHYGARCNPITAWISKFVFKHADVVLAVSDITKKEVGGWIKPKKLYLIYNGVDEEKFKPKGEKEDLILTVGSKQKEEIRLKGLEAFVKSAAVLPEKKFVVIGPSNDAINYLKSFGSPNVEFVSFSKQDDLIEYYQRAKVYCQLSYRESFGMALVEAMACECVPVVTDRVALPEVVGDVGFYVPYNNSKATADAVKKALASPEKGKMARERIIRLFSIREREKQLVKIINELIEIKGENQ